MADSTTKKSSKKLTKKEARKEIYDKLAPVLSEYRKVSGNKKFDRRLQKASKLFAPLVIKEKAADKVKTATKVKTAEKN